MNRGRVDLDSIHTVRVFAGLSDEALEELVRVIRARIYGRDQVVVEEGSTEWGVSAVVEGGARVVERTESGDEAVLGLVHPGDVFGLVALVTGLPTPWALEATSEGTAVFHVPRKSVQLLMQSEPAFTVAVGTVLGEQLKALAQRYSDLVLYDVETRLAHTLARYSRGPAVGAQTPLRMTHAELAALVGTGRSDVTRALRPLRERGLIWQEPHMRGIVIVDYEALKDYRKFE